MKKILILLCFISLSSNISARSNKNDLISYSESVDVFEVVEQLASWWSDIPSELTRHWRKELKLTYQEQSLISRYSVLRKKVNGHHKKDHSLVFTGGARHIDYMSQAFYTSKSVGHALMKLKGKLKKENLDLLVELFNTLKPKITTMVKESTQFRGKLRDLNKHFKKQKGPQVFKKAMKFFQIKNSTKDPFKAFFVWWPKGKGTQVEVVGRTVLLKYNPVSDFNSLDINEVNKGLVLAMLYSMGSVQREVLSKRFSSKCDYTPFFRPPLTGSVVEDALSIALGPMMREGESLKKKFNLSKRWSDNTWTNHYAKQLYPLVFRALKLRETISGGFVEQAGIACQEIVTLAIKLQKLARRTE